MLSDEEKHIPQLIFSMFQLGKSRPTTMTLVESQEKNVGTLKLPTPSASLTIRTVDDGTGGPVFGASIRLERVDAVGVFYQRSEEGSEHTFYLPPQKLYIIVSKPGYETWRFKGAEKALDVLQFSTDTVLTVRLRSVLPHK